MVKKLEKHKYRSICNPGLSKGEQNMTQSQMLGKVESGGGPILKVVLEC